MISPTITLDKDYLPNLIKRLEKLRDEYVDIGMFQEQGMHPNAVTFSHAGLFGYHMTGDPNKNIPSRPVLEVAFKFNPLKKSPLKKDLQKYLSKIKSINAPIKISKILKNTGGYYMQKSFEVFGSEVKLQRNSDFTKAIKASKGYDPNKPLIETGSLASKISYRINGKTIVEHG